MRVLVVARYRVRGPAEQMVLSLFPPDWTVAFLGVDDSDGEMSQEALKEARAAFDPEQVNADGVFVLGNEALYAVLGLKQVMKEHGRVHTLANGIVAVASVAPAAVKRNPSQFTTLRNDADTLIRTLRGETLPDIEPPEIVIVDEHKTLVAFHTSLDNAHDIAFDLETSGLNEFDPGAFVVSLAATLMDVNGNLSCWAVPLCHSDSSWMSWKDKLQEIAYYMRGAPVRIAHNAKFDCRWMAQFDAPVSATFDTMLAAHLLDENRPSSLKELARTLLKAPEWDIKIKGGKKAPPWYEQHALSDILRYNAIDTWHTMKLYLRFRDELEKKPALGRIFKNLTMPASQSLVHIERHKIYADQERLQAGFEKATQRVEELDQELLTYVPAETPHPVKWGRTLFQMWLLFDHLQLPVIRRTDTGAPSMDKATQMAWRDQGYDIAALLLERVHWAKQISSFFGPYKTLVDENSRIGTTFRLNGTVTGRLSSGKSTEESLSFMSEMGVNIQQVPKDKLVRGVFGAPPGSFLVVADYSQLELRLIAEVAQERNMIDMYQRGVDLHTNMAMQMTGKADPSLVTYEERNGAKPVNFGFGYGMDWETFIVQSYKDYGVLFTEEDAKKAKRAFFETYPDLLGWHSRARRHVRKYKSVATPLGRVRHLPDIDSPDPEVRSSAERQAINSPIQGMGSDLCLLSLALLDRKFRKAGFKASVVATVHDSIIAEVPANELDDVCVMIKRTMEHPPTQRLFGYEMQVPLIADISYGTHWSDQKELKL